MIRVGDNFASQLPMFYLRQRQDAVSELQNRIATGHRIERVSDDLPDASLLVARKQSLAQVKQFEENAAYAGEFVQSSESALLVVENLFQELKGHSIKDVEDDNLAKARIAELNQVLDELLSIANQTYGGRYLFGGSNGEEPPFTINQSRTLVSANPKGTNGDQQVRISENVTENILVGGEQVFQNGTDLFKVVIDLRTAYENRSSDDLKTVIGSIDDGLGQVLDNLGEVGARINRIQLAETTLHNRKLSLDGTVSRLEDLNLAEAITQLQSEQVAMRASLTISSELIQQTLLDYLR